MKTVCNFLLLALLVNAVLTNPVPAREVTDMVGRTVTVPDTINKVYSPSPQSTLMLYALDPSFLCSFSQGMPGTGWRQLLDPRVRDLPNLGSITGEGLQTNLETLLNTEFDLTVIFPNSEYEVENYAVHSRTAAVFARLNRPYVYIWGVDLVQSPDAFEYLATLVDRTERGKILAAYVRNTIEEAEAVWSQIPPADRPKVYYAVGADGLSTFHHDSMHALILKLAGEVGVHTDRRGLTSQTGPFHDKISLERIIQYNPDYILAETPAFYNSVYSNPAWRQVRAVRDRQVYLAPRGPFNWTDRPPSFMQALGLKWLMNIIYPEQYDIDIVAESIEFYKLFLWADVTPEEMCKIINPYE